ncbi:hypothetical protein [Gilliamella intestini]|uniref:hypothetical protein n=1 Tax=Gilliamella intestini TaxID=1798183 RepID=UPI000B861C3D|nr:hypothetical protein [Gilliamella intestini]
MSQIDLNGQTLSTHRWQEGNEIARSMGRFGELNCHQQFDNRGRLLNYINPRFKTAGIFLFYFVILSLFKKQIKSIFLLKDCYKKHNTF